MEQVNWNQFKLKNKNSEEAFENLCYSLFCREHGLPGGIFGYKNQTGIEREPVLVNRKYVGFQCKFFESQFKWTPFKEGLEKAKSKNPNLQIYRVYSNQDFTEGRNAKKSQGQIHFEEVAKKLGVKVEYFVNGQFNIVLETPKNLELAQLYFGTSNEFAFVRRSVNHRIQTLLTSTEFIGLPIEKESKVVTNVVSSIKLNRSKTSLFIGNPGSGKSCFMHSLFRSFAGLDKTTEQQMLNQLLKNGAVPMLINLKSCTSESLEQIIARRQDESQVRNNELGFIYILDGLDELSDEKADQTLTFLKEIENLDKTVKIILSCRSGNLNKVKAKIYFEDIVEYRIKELEYESLKTYFKSKADKEKQKRLTFLKNKNPQLIENVKDILLIRLLWDTIETLSDSSSVADLMEKKLALLLNGPEHKKNIDALNLLDMKSDAIFEINKKISYIFQEKYQYRFSRSELQEIILSDENLTRLSYKDVNELISYISNLFFDSTSDVNQSNPSFIYQHRRYQEFFFTQKLKDEYEKNPAVLRKFNLLTNKKYFQDYFMKYLRSKYEHSENLIGLIDLNFLDVYLGNDSGFGVDDAHHLNSDQFILALISQPEQSFEEFMQGENFDFENIIFINLDNLEKKINLWKKEPKNYSNNRYIESVWNYGISSHINNLILFWDSGKTRIARELADNLNEAISLFRTSGFLSESEHAEHLHDPFWDSLESYLSSRIVLRNTKLKTILNENIRNTYEGLDSGEISNNRYLINHREKLVTAFFHVALRRAFQQLPGLIASLDDYEFRVLLRELSKAEFIHIFVQSENLQSKIKKHITGRNIEFNPDESHIAFYKKFLRLPLTDDELNAAKTSLEKFRSERYVDWSFANIPERYSLLSYALDINNFDKISTEKDDRFRYYDPLEVYSALFESRVSLLQNKTTVSLILRDFVKYNQLHDQRVSVQLKYDIGTQWGLIFSHASVEEVDDLIRIKNIIFAEQDLSHYSFIRVFRDNNLETFKKVVNTADLKKIHKILQNPDSFQDLVDSYFSLSILYCEIDPVESRRLFIKGLRESVLRHGWRKDPIVSYYLVRSLEVLWRNTYCETEILKELTLDVFKLGIAIGNLTDDAGDGPYNVVDFVAKYDIEFAEELKEMLIKEKNIGWGRNSLVTSILTGKVIFGYPYYDIEDEMSEYKKDYSHSQEPRADSYEEKIKIFMLITDSELYNETERKDAFLKAYSLVEDMKKEGVKYYLSDTHYRELKRKYLGLCEKYEKQPNIEISNEENEFYDDKELLSDSKQIQNKIESIKSITALKKFYKSIEDYKTGVLMTSYTNWRLLINQTIKYTGDVSLLVELLNKYGYPSSDRYSTNSKNLHLAIAAGISNFSSRKEIYQYLYSHTGHGGFYNMMKVYETLNDRETCIQMFNRYLQLCHLISDESE